MRTIGVWFSLILGLALLLPIAQGAETADANPPDAAPAAPQPMTPEQRQQMMGMMQDMMVMASNTAAWSPQGLYVLQGNRLLHYAPDLTLKQQISLPLPPAMPADTMPNLRGMVMAKLLPTDNGVVLIRGMQVLRFDQNLRQLNMAMLPDLPAMTDAEKAAACPMCQMMMMMMPMGGGMGQMGTMNMGAGGCPMCGQ